MPEERARLMSLNESEVHPEPRGVVVVDDVLATGSHFRASKMILRQRWPAMRVIGVFLARVCRPPRF
jgi:predicted amidophosphoribosyltransferase